MLNGVIDVVILIYYGEFKEYYFSVGYKVLVWSMSS